MLLALCKKEIYSAVSCLPKILVILYTTSIAAQGDPTQALSLLPPNVTLTKSTFGAEQWLNIAEGGKGFEMVIECSELNQSSKKGEGVIPNILPNSKQNILSKENCWHMSAIACNYSFFFNQCNQSICQLDQLNCVFWAFPEFSLGPSPDGPSL